MRDQTRWGDDGEGNREATVGATRYTSLPYGLVPRVLLSSPHIPLHLRHEPPARIEEGNVVKGRLTITHYLRPFASLIH